MNPHRERLAELSRRKVGSGLTVPTACLALVRDVLRATTAKFRGQPQHDLPDASRRRFLSDGGSMAAAVLFLRGGRILTGVTLTDVAFAVTPSPHAGVAGSVQLTGNAPGSMLTLGTNPGSAYSLSNAGDVWTLSWTTAVTQRTDVVNIVQTLAGAVGNPKTTALSLIFGAFSQTPVLVAYTRNFGDLTKTGNGAVKLSKLMLAPGSPAPSTWTVAAASTGLDSHWTRPSAGVAEGSSALTPKISSTGNSAVLSSRTYVHSITCTGADGSTSNAVNLTTLAVANAVSVGDFDAVPDGSYTPTNTLGMTTSAFLALNSGAAKSILLMAGIDQQGIRWGGMSGFDFTSQVKVKWADATPGRFSQFNHTSCNFLKFEGINLTGTTFVGNGIWLFTDCYDIGLDDCGFNGGTTAAWLAGPAAGTMYAFTLKNTNARFTINRFTAMNVYGGINVASVLTQTDFTWNNYYCRYFADNAVFWAYITNWTFNDMVTASPTRWHTDGGHVDHLQGQDASLCTNLVINRYVLIDADGDAYSGTIFGVVGTYTFTNIIIINRGNQGFYLSGVPSGASAISKFSMLKGMGVNFNTEIQDGLDIDDSCCSTYNPDLLLRNCNDAPSWAGTLTVQSGFIYDSVSYTSTSGSASTKPANVTVAASVKAAGIGSSGGGHNPQSDILNYFASDRRADYNAITDAQWKAMDAAGLVAKALQLLTPKVSGLLDAGGGVALGAVSLAGAWN